MIERFYYIYRQKNSSVGVVRRMGYSKQMHPDPSAIVNAILALDPERHAKVLSTDI